MSIDRVNIGSQGVDRSLGTQSTETSRSAGTDRQVSVGADSVALSSTASDFTRLGNTIEQSRTDHFNRIQMQLESGSYRVSAEDLAEKLIAANMM